MKSSKKNRRFILLLGLWSPVQGIFCQVEPATHREAIAYILRYKDLALEEMYKSGIPASIKLGQAVLESNFGRSPLAIDANNHFGAKCHNTWYGPSILYDDDLRNECFRKYENAELSFRDHSKVLAKDRYLSLYKLDRRDYKSWSHGLQKAGYATDPNYAEKLIAIIERYSLYVYDGMPYIPGNENNIATQPETVLQLVSIDAISPAPLSVRETNCLLEPCKINKIGRVKKQKPLKFRSVPYVQYEVNVLPVQIADVYELPEDKLLIYNGITESDTFPAGKKIFLRRLNNKAEKKFSEHKVKSGERIEDIALHYGIDPATLREKNILPNKTQPKPGSTLSLRHKVKFPPPFYGSENEFRQSFREERLEGKKQSLTVVHPKMPANITMIDEFEVVEKITGNLPDAIYKENAGFLLPISDALKPISISPSKNDSIEKPTIFDMPEFTTNNGAASEKKPEASPTMVMEQELEITRPEFHIVQPNENLYRISLKYGVSLDSLKAFNGIQNDIIRIGQKLRLN